MNEITVFTNGDSSKIKTWSNVPYFFTETLMAKGIRVNRVDLSPSKTLRSIYKRSYQPIIKLIFKHTSYEFFRSNLHFTNIRKRIKKAINKYPKSDAFIFLTFSFSACGLTNKPIIQFCDWTYHHYITFFLNRNPDFIESRCIKREDSQIIGSDLIFPLFPGVSDYMRLRYQKTDIFYLGNVINSLIKPLKTEAIELKKKSNKLLFVGNQKYHEGAVALIEAFELIRKEQPQLTLHIIGMKTNDFPKLSTNVYCHGYLDKAVDTERDLYYNLFKEAKLFINTTPKWAAFSASIEAMYFYTPVVISPTDEFVKTFGENINFGVYCESKLKSVIAEKIIRILRNTSYEELCNNAHISTKDYTWSSYLDKMIAKIEAKLNPDEIYTTDKTE